MRFDFLKGNNLKKKLITILIVVMALSSLTYASVISGYVYDAQSGDPLPGANLVIPEYSIGASSDIKGEFTIRNVKPGEVTVKISFIGYQSKAVTVQVPEDGRINKTFELSAVNLQGEAVEVTAQAKGQMDAINKQLSSSTITNQVSSSKIQELPDANAAESVGRLPGISIKRSGGEGNKVVIRGLSPKFSNIKINGVKMAATGGGDRSVDLSGISPYMLEGIEVTKANLPSQDGDAMGGSVNFKVKKAKKGLKIDLLVQGGYNALRDSYKNYKVVGSISNRFIRDKIGLFAQIDIDQKDRSSNNFGGSYSLPAPKLDQKNKVILNSLNLSDVFRDKLRYNGTFVVDYEIPDGLIKLTNFVSHSNTNSHSFSDSYGINDKNRVYGGGDSESDITVMTNVLSLEKSVRKFKLNMDISYTFSESKDPNSLSWSFTEPSAFVDSLNVSVHPKKLYNYTKNNVKDAYFSNISSSDTYSKENSIAFKTDVQYQYTLTDKISGYLQTGIKLRNKSKKYDRNSIGNPRIGYAHNAEWKNEIWNLLEQPENGPYFTYDHFVDEGYKNNDFLQGDYIFGPVAQTDLIKDVAKIALQEDIAVPYAKINVIDDYTGEENYFATYFMAEINLGPSIKLIPGVRYESMETQYTGIRGDSRGGVTRFGYPHIDTTMTRKNTFWLPIVNLRIKPTKWCDVRFAYTNSLNRPNYNWIVPKQDLNTSWVRWNNYKLKPAVSENFDLSASFYQNYIGLFTFGGYYKQINDFMMGTGSRILLDPSAYDLPESVKGHSFSEMINNEQKVDLWGIETEWQTHFWYLPGALKGLILNANYSHIFSEAQYPRTTIENKWEDINNDGFPELIQANNDTTYTDRLIDQPDDILNLTVGYDFKKFSIRISMLYQDDMFRSTNFWPELRSTTDEYLRWDLSLKQELPVEGMQLFCNINNITESKDKVLQRGNSFPTSEQFYGRTISLGIRYKF